MEKKTILKVKKQDMVACFTCPICDNLYDRATNISECLHTFCRKCIEDKFIVENLKACPVCNVDLGVAPLDKLRPDNTWDELKLHVFKQKPESVKAATGTASTSLKYSRKKKKYVPSLMATSTTVLTSPERKFEAPLEPEKLGEQPEPSSSIPDSNLRRRPRKNLRPQRNETRLQPEQPYKDSENGFHILLNIEREQDIEQENEQEQDVEQDNGLAQASTSKGYIQKENNSGKDNEEIPVSSDDLGKSLSTDKEVAPLKSNGTALSVETAITPNGKAKEDRGSEGDREEVPREANKKHVLSISDIDTEEVSCEKLKKNGEEKQENVSTTSGEISGKKENEKAYSPPALRPRRQRNMNPENKVEGSNMQVWFSLIAAPNQNTDRPLPQIPSHYIRVKNGNLPVSYVKKYLVYKLGLESEDEVEIWLREELVCSTQKLHELVDWCVQTTPIAERKTAMVGSSGAEFVMVLHYSGSRLLE